MKYIHTLSELAIDIPLTQIDIPPAVYEITLPQSSIDDENGPLMFNIPIEQLMGSEGENGLPRVVKDCVTFLRAEGLYTEGVFRRSPSSVLLKQAKDAYDRGNPINLEDYGVHVAAVLLKMFFNNLPVAVFPVETYDLLRQIRQRPQNFGKIEFIRSNIFPLLSHATILLLKYVCGLLVDVSKHKDKNLMTSYNLAVMFAPNLVHSGNPLIDVSMCTLVENDKENDKEVSCGGVGIFMKLSINYFDLMFEGYEDPSDRIRRDVDVDVETNTIMTTPPSTLSKVITTPPKRPSIKKMRIGAGVEISGIKVQGMLGIVLRLRKSNYDENDSNDEDNENMDIDSTTTTITRDSKDSPIFLCLYIDNVVKPLLGESICEYVGETILLKVQTKFLKELSNSIRRFRSVKRLHKDIDFNQQYAILTSDQTQFPLITSQTLPSSILLPSSSTRSLSSSTRSLSRSLSSSSRSLSRSLSSSSSSSAISPPPISSPTLSIELKPKWLFLPSSPFISPQNSIKFQTCRFCMHKHYKQKDNKFDQSSITGYCPLDLISFENQRMEKSIEELFKCPDNNLKIFLQGEQNWQQQLSEFFEIDVFNSPDGNQSQNKLIMDSVVKLLSKTILAESSLFNHLKYLQRTLDETDIEGIHKLYLNQQQSKSNLLDPTIEEWKFVKL
ncbi:10293_t:CDS:10 [Diversispora eburnea]|uniref:Inositol-pentakisphosphate 2-kinase n=1 Tax=Diversispora eburnea TaxID=1213867 RepID=A0A9N8V6R9_9GLOM|nr:10293_t:CDS:10 [Diversispora eburnea]